MKLTKERFDGRMNAIKGIIEDVERYADEETRQKKLKQALAMFCINHQISLRILRENYVKLLILADKLTEERKQRVKKALGLRGI